MNDWLLVLLSVAYVSAALVLAKLLCRCTGLLRARKLVHILVSLWVLICFHIESPFLRLMGPLAFTGINYIYHRKGFQGLGIVFFPLSLFLLLMLNSLGLISQDAVTGSVLVMGLGDGAAAVAGDALGHSRKSLAGSFVMALVTLLLFLFFSRSWLSVPAALAVAAVEHITPGGYDNIAVPFSAALLLEVMCAP